MELAARYQLGLAQITRWKQYLRQQATQVFAPATFVPAAAPPDLETLFAAIGRLQMQNALLKNAAPMSTNQQRYLAQAPDAAGSLVVAHCRALGLSRSSYYYQPTET